MSFHPFAPPEAPTTMLAEECSALSHHSTTIGTLCFILLPPAHTLDDFNAYAPNNRFVPGIAFIVAQESSDSSLTSAIDAARTS
jgi:hypothetical protein